MFHKDILVIVFIIEGSRDCWRKHRATEFCASLFGAKMPCSSSPKFCSNFGGGSGLKKLTEIGFMGGQHSQPSRELPFSLLLPMVFTQLRQRMVFVYFMALLCLLLSSSLPPEKSEIHEQKILLPILSSFRKAEKVEIFGFHSPPLHIYPWI